VCAASVLPAMEDWKGWVMVVSPIRVIF
jgi:hypothetical protein